MPIVTEVRVRCDIDGCKRSMGVDSYTKRFGHPPGQLICGNHWRLVSKRTKRVLARHRRKAKRFGWDLPGLRKAHSRIWRYAYLEMTHALDPAL